MDYQANTRYLTHCGGGGEPDIAAVFPLDGEVTAIATSAAPRWTTAQDWTKDVREARRNTARVIVERLKELGVERGRIGITGLGEVEGTRTPEGTIFTAHGSKSAKAFPHAQLVDATAILTEVRIREKPGRDRRACQIDGNQRMAIQAEIEAAKPASKTGKSGPRRITRMTRNGSRCRFIAIGYPGKSPSER